MTGTDDAAASPGGRLVPPLPSPPPAAPSQRSTPIAGLLESTLERLNEARDSSGLGAFRLLFGGLMCFSVLRFWAYGWIDDVYLRPSFHFTYFGFDWVEPWPGNGLYLHFALMALAAFSLCIGLFSRASAAIFFVTFTYAELIEKASYLNHYYLVSLLSLLLAVVPSGAAFSLDALLLRRRGQARREVRRWVYTLLRTQAGLVYFFAGLAKLNPDWLLDAQPLATWLGLHGDVPLIGAWLREPAFAYVASYLGAAFDLSIPFLLSARRARPYAYAVLVCFHVSVWLLFPIGVFSWVMIVTATLFFDPAWAKRAAERLTAPRETTPATASAPLTRVKLALLGGYLLVQLCVPLRYLLYPGNVNWHEQGFRFAWRVMLVEKAGQVEFTVVCDDDQRYVVRPRDALTALQHKMMATQPDMIQQYARHLRRTFAARGHTRVRVYADAWVSMNGRPRQRLIDPNVDLAGAPDTLAPKSWILPLSARRPG
jgi:vitamin K-dependent gamma-carboxylase